MSQSPFVVDQLKPEGLNGASAGQVYQLTAASASPTRIIGRDDLGLPVEDTIPTVHWKYMVHPAGHINKVTLRTSSVFTREPEAERYELQQMTELIQAGWIPIEMCPHSTQYTHITRGPFVKAPPGVEDCGGVGGDGRMERRLGEPSRCVHMDAVIAKRLEMSKKKHDAEHDRIYKLKNEDAIRMQEAMTDGIGKAIAANLQNMPTPPRERLRQGKGEE